MKKYLLIMLIALLGVVSCQREETGLPVGGCELRIDFGTGRMLTRADTPGDGNVADGGGIYIDDSDPSNPVPDLVILIANSSGTVVATYPDDVPDEDVDSILDEDPETTAMSVTFIGLDEGTYSVYAFANTGGYWDMEGQGGASAKNYLLSLSTSSAIEALRFSDLFATVAASVCPNDDDANAPDRLPLSAKGSVSVTSLHTGEVSLEMLRCVAKVTAEFVNNTGESLTLYDFCDTLKGICPNRAYVIAGNPDSPTGTLAGDILAAETSLSIPAVDPLDPSELGSVSKSWYVFPSTGPYTCSVEFTLAKGDPGEKNYKFIDLPVHDDHAISITSLPRNKHLHIITKISKGTTVSFNFEVVGWESTHTENVLFE